MNRRRLRRAKSEINVVPYIDVMLVLLVIFMVTAPMMQQGTIELPSVGSTVRQSEQQKPLILQIGAQGQFELLDGKGSQAYPDLPALVAVLPQQLQADASMRPVVIAADREVRYEVVVQAMDALKRAGVERVGLQVQVK